MALKFTPTGQRMMDLLSQGRASREQLEGCMEDDLVGASALRVHIHRLRRELKKINRNVMSTFENGVTYYELVQSIVDPRS